MIADFYVEENFITEDQRLSVRQTVLNLQPHWSTHRPEKYSGVNFSTLGNALYIMESDAMRIEDINQQVRQILLENFGWLYQRICDKIQHITGQPTMLHPFLTVPGFHLGHKPGVMTDDTIAFFHRDMSILSYDPESNMETNRSVLIAIETPSSGAYLMYKQNNEVKKFHYKTGALHQWDARLEHKVGGLTLMPGEHRITLQSHYYYNARMKCNLVYF